jgi:hypothetical protein
MRSTKGVAAAATFLLAVPLALAVQIASGSDGAAELVIHLAVGSASVLLALAVFDFTMPRWATWIGSTAAAAFGAIFLLQAASQLMPNEALRYIAYDVLGQEIEAVLPYVIAGWFVALLIWGSRGKTRILGAALMAPLVAVEVAAIVGPVVGLKIDSVQLLFLLPFPWLLAESVKRSATVTREPSPTRAFADGGVV